MAHSDNNGLVLPPKLAPIQVVLPIVDTARFLKEQGKVPAAGTDYRQYVTDRFVK